MLNRDSEIEVWSRIVWNSWYELNPRVRCAFGNVFLKRAAHLGAGQNLLSDIVRMFEHPSFNFEPHPWMLFQRLTDAKNSREPEHVMVQGDQHLTIVNFDFKHMMWIMNQYLKTPRHVMVWGDQKLIFTSCILFTWCKIWSSRTWKTQTWAKKCPTMALPKLSNQWSW